MKKVIVDNKAVAVGQTVTKFGIKQVGKTTPPWAKNVFRYILYAAAIGNIVVDIFPEIPLDVKGLLAMYSIKAVALVHALTKLFGMELKDPE